MPIMDIILRVKSVAEITALADTYNILKKLEAAGVDVSKPLRHIDIRMKQLHMNTTKVARIFKPFRMELLSVMFGAQMVSRAITGLFRPALEMAGVFEILGIGLAVFFLPAVMALLTPLMDLVNWFISLPEPVKLMIGALLGVVAAFFTFLSVEAAFKLFFDGFLRGASEAGTALDGLKVKAQEFASYAGKAYAVTLVFGGVKEIGEGKILSGTAELLKGAGIFAITMGGKNKAFGGWMLTAGLVLDMADKAVNKQKINSAEIVSLLVQAGIAGFAFGGWWGTGFAIIVTLVLTDIIFKSGIVSKWNNWVEENINKKLGTAGKSGDWRGGGTPPIRQGGGYISQTGLYKLHAGESVSTAGDTFNSSPVINVYGGGTDSSDLVSRIADEVTRNLSSMARR